MSSSMTALSTSTSVPCEPRPHLASSVVAPRDLTVADRRQMYELLRKYFSGTTRAGFDADLREKESVILVRDGRTGRIQGFSTLMRMRSSVDGREVVAFFSGDTIVDRRYWGETLLSRTWGETVLTQAERVVAEYPETSVYWFLICSGYKTWRFLPLFFRKFYPNADTPTPPHIRRILDTLGTAKFGDQYRADQGIVRFRHATPLRPGIADVTEERLRDPNVAFFVERNPGHAAGDELACLAALWRSNLTRAAHRLISRVNSQPPTPNRQGESIERTG